MGSDDVSVLPFFIWCQLCFTYVLFFDKFNGMGLAENWDPFDTPGGGDDEDAVRHIPDNLSPKEFWERCKSDFEYYALHCLRIRVKDIETGRNKMIPFALNAEQGVILKEFVEMERKKKPVRIIILKSRKIGFSTLIEAYGHWKCQFNKHYLAKCMAHRKESTEEIFEIAHRYQTHQHPAIQDIAPGKHKRSSRDMGIYWEHDSRFEVETQGATDADRGATPDYLHLSELGLWWKKRKTTSDADVMQSSMGSISDVHGTYVIIESTACGSAGAFYDRFWKAWKREPGNLFKAFFFGWQDHAKYRLDERPGDKVYDRKLRKAYRDDDQPAFWRLAEKMGYDERWARRAIIFELKPCQVRWALQTLLTKFDGDIKAFDTEFPLSPEIAFTSSSSSPLDQVKVRQKLTALGENPPESRAYEAIEWNARNKAVTLVDGAPRWRIWHDPEPGHEYLLTIDTAHGSDEGDFSCIQVGDRTDRKQVAEFYHRSPPDVVAAQALAAGMYYNVALVSPEVDGPGLATLQNLLEYNQGAGYPNIYVRSASGNWTQRFGFKMGHKGKRDACVAALSRAIRYNSWDFYSETLLRECQTFITTAKGRCEAMPGEHDDAVFAAAQMLYIDTEMGEASALNEEHEELEKRDSFWSRFFTKFPEGHDSHLGTRW